MKILSLVLSIGLLLGATRAAAAEGPTADYKINDEYTTKSPDGATTVEQYHGIDKDGNYHWRISTAVRNRGRSSSRNFT